MIRFRAAGTEFRMHALTLAAGALALALGMSDELPALIMAMCVHELAHLAAARACGLDVEYIEIMPFGGAAHIRDVYSAPRIRLMITAAAGPLANLLLATLSAALAWWEALSFAQAAIIVRINLILMLFNLLPALQLDGGRIFYAIATIWLSPRLALCIGAGAAHLLAAGLAALTLVGWFTQGVVNLTFLILAVFLVASSLAELRAAREGGAVRTLDVLCGGEKLPSRAQLVLMAADGAPNAAAEFMRPGTATVFAMVDNGGITSFITGAEMARRIIAGDGDMPI